MLTIENLRKRLEQFTLEIDRLDIKDLRFLRFKWSRKDNVA